MYQTTNIVNGKLYIGCHSTDNIEDGYKGSGLLLKHAIAKYGASKFVRTVLFIFDNPTEMFSKEKELVNEEFVTRHDVYNIMLGGNGGLNKGIIGQRRLHHPVTKKRIVAHKSSIDKLLLEGYILKSGWGTHTGRIYIHKDEQVKSITTDQLEEMINDGWSKGMPISPTQGKIWIYHSELDEYSLCETSELSMKLSTGWIKKKWAPVKKGTAWVNNGTDNLRISKEEIATYTSNGWKKGMITSRWS